MRRSGETPPLSLSLSLSVTVIVTCFDSHDGGTEGGTQRPDLMSTEFKFSKRQALLCWERHYKSFFKYEANHGLFLSIFIRFTSGYSNNFNSIESDSNLSRRMVSADGSTEIWRPPFIFLPWKYLLWLILGTWTICTWCLWTVEQIGTMYWWSLRW